MSLDKPDWHDVKDRELYEQLFYHQTELLTEQEEEFCKTMYHLEEFACGLDG